MKKYFFNAVIFVCFVLIVLMKIDTYKNRKEIAALRDATPVLADKIDSTAVFSKHLFNLEGEDELGLHLVFSKEFLHSKPVREYFSVSYKDEGRYRGNSYSLEDTVVLYYGDYRIISRDGKLSVLKDGEELLTRYPDGTVKSSSFLSFESRSGYYPALQALN